MEICCNVSPEARSMISMPLGDTVKLIRVSLLLLAAEKVNRLFNHCRICVSIGDQPLAAAITLLTASLVACVELAVSTTVSPRCLTAKVVESASSIVSGRSPRSRRLVASAHSSHSSGGTIYYESINYCLIKTGLSFRDYILYNFS